MPNRVTDPVGPTTRLRERVASGGLLLLVLVFAYAVNLPTPRQGAAATTTLTSSAAAPAPDATHEHNVTARATSLQPARIEDTEAACYRALRDAGVAYQPISHAAVSVIDWPIVLTGPIDGVRVHGTGKADDPTNYLDCRLAKTLLTWAPELRAKGVIGLEHYSMYRAEAVVGHSRKPSGHATGRAIDVAKFELNDGRTLSVLDDWTQRKRGADPCQAWPDKEAGKLVRALVCAAAARGLFQIIVTPHYNDAHANHVHLEADPQLSVLWIR